MIYKYLLFDADNTLFDFDECEKRAFLSLFSLDAEVFNENNLASYHKINDSLWKDAELGRITKPELKVKRFKLLFNSLGKEITPNFAEIIAKAYTDNLSKFNVLIDGAYEILEYLYPAYEIFIITNGIASVQRMRLSSSPINRFIKKIFISEEIGFEKPDIRYFEQVMTEVGNNDASKFLIIGDSLSSDIKGAQNIGIDSVFFSLKSIASETSAKYHIRSLHDLKLIL